MNKFLLPFAGYICAILPLLISCSAPPPPAKTTTSSVVKASAATVATSSLAATHKSTLSSLGSSSSSPSTPKVVSPSPVPAVAKPALKPTAASSSVAAQQNSSFTPIAPPPERNLLDTTSVDSGRNRISGSVLLLDKNGEALSPEGVIINLEPVAPVTMNHKNTTSLQPAQHRIDMRNKTYLPRFLAVKQNDLVSFVNKDNIKHNTFSSSGENTFDLGTFGPGITQSAKLVAPGIVKIYCNIHPEMASFVSVSAHNYSFITQADGKFVISDLPQGRYSLTAWHIRGEIQQSVDLTKDIANHVVTIDTSAFAPTPHKNKYGENYKVKPALFNDEFY